MLGPDGVLRVHHAVWCARDLPVVDHCFGLHLSEVLGQLVPVQEVEFTEVYVHAVLLLGGSESGLHVRDGNDALASLLRDGVSPEVVVYAADSAAQFRDLQGKGPAKVPVDPQDHYTHFFEEVPILGFTPLRALLEGYAWLEHPEFGASRALDEKPLLGDLVLYHRYRLAARPEVHVSLKQGCGAVPASFFFVMLHLATLQLVF